MPYGDAVTRRWITLGVVEAVLASLLAAIVYHEIFSRYATWDDEGYMMLLVRHFLAGHRLYDEVWTLYGPVYFFYKWLLHGLVGLPLTHDVVRLSAMAVWVLTGAVAAIAALGLTGSLALAAVAQMLVTFHLKTIVNEPGHPQELCGLLTMATVAIPALAHGEWRAGTLVGLGLGVAALVMTKVNLGIFVAIGIWMALLSLVPATLPTVALRTVSSAVLVALPWLFMRQLLGLPWLRNFAATQSMTFAALALLTLSRRDGVLRAGQLVLFASASIGGVVLIGLLTLAKGTTFAALRDCLITAPLRMPALFVYAPPVFFPPPSAAAVALALAVGMRATERWRAAPHLLAFAKLVFGTIAVRAAWSYDFPLLFGRLTPLLWLAALPPRGERETAPSALARLVLCWVAVLEPLQAYPVAGSQVSFGTALHVLVGVVCLGDGVRWVRSLWPVLARREIQIAVPGAVLLAVACLSLWRLGQSRQRYVDLVPLDLPGASRLHLPPMMVDTFRALTRTLREQSDTFVSIPGFNSLYFWTGEDPPTLDVIGNQIRFYSDERQAAILSALLQHPRPMVVHFPGLAPPDALFEARLGQSFKHKTQIDGYDLLVPR
jgi:hypothetical protein